MTDQIQNPEPSSSERDKQLNALQIQLRSQRAGEILRGMTQVRKWLQEDPEDRQVYEILLDAVQENHDIREKVRNLFLEMMQKGSKGAEEAISFLPSSVQDLLADADDAYYAAEYGRAIQLYHQVLKRAPDDERAMAYLAKATSAQKIAGELILGLPREAVQFYRRARSFIAAEDFSTAMKMLSAAIESAQARDRSYPDAEQLLNTVQDLLIAAEFRAKAILAVETGQREDALDLYNKALTLDPTNVALKKELDSLQDLLSAEHDLLASADFKVKAKLALEKEQWGNALDLYSQAFTLDPKNVVLKRELDSLQDLWSAEMKLSKLGALKIFASLSHIRDSLEIAKSVLGPDNPLMNLVAKQLKQIRLIRIGCAIVILVSVLFLNSKFEPYEALFFKPTRTDTPAVFLASETPTPVVEFSATVTVTSTLTASATETLLPTLTAIPVLGYGKLIEYTFPLEIPNGDLLGLQLRPKQYITIVERQEINGFVWYKCKWELDGAVNEGWILEKYIQFAPPPTATPTP